MEVPLPKLMQEEPRLQTLFDKVRGSVWCRQVDVALPSLPLLSLFNILLLILQT